MYAEQETEDKEYVKDTQIDTDFELLFPDDYINNISERLNLYTQLNNLKTKKSLRNLKPNWWTGLENFPLMQKIC